MTIETKLVVVSFITMAIVLCQCAPRSKNKVLPPQTVYDQKQTGDYNIQLHLKDFQIIALLADDSIGALGDYDYNYDYADFTVKPTGPTTAKPSTEASSESSVKPENHDSHPIASSSSTTAKPVEKPAAATEVPATSISSKPIDNSDLNEVDKTTTSIQVGSTSSSPPQVATTTQKTEELPNTPGQIKVQILETPVYTNIGIVPGEELSSISAEALPQGEIMKYRRCLSGYARDKKGRCRRLRRPGAVSPQLPFGISRLASNLASRFRYASSESSLSSSSSSESAED